jgi:prepilin-type N-terminal cleavage/methylation domain-containing protein
MDVARLCMCDRLCSRFVSHPSGAASTMIRASGKNGPLSSRWRKVYPASKRMTHPRDGLTIIELLIVVAIVGFLISISIPAIQASREASRRHQCTSNLRQVGLALQSYHDQHARLPPAAVWAPAGEPLGHGVVPPGTIDRVSLGVASVSNPDRTFSNWVIAILPSLEEEMLRDSLDVRLPIGYLHNRKAASTELSIMKCPSDAWNGIDNQFLRGGLSSPDAGYARGNYAMNGGSNKGCLMRLSGASPPGSCIDGYQVNGTQLEKDVSQVWGSGIGGINKSFGFRDFPRGLSRTVAVEEIRSGIHPLDRRGVWALGFVGSSITAAHGRWGNRGPNAGSDSIQGCGAITTLIGDPSNSGMPCSKSSDPLDDISDRATARSLHQDGVNLMMMDGSVHFVTNSVDRSLWHEMHKRDSQAAFDGPF